MTAAFAEAIRDLLLPCSLTIVVPGVAAVLATRRDSLPVFAAGLVGTVVIGWLRISEQLPARPVQPWVWGLGVAVVIAFGALAFDETRRAQRVTASTVIGGAAAWVWSPCVGAELGEILSTAPGDPVAALGPFFAFVLGLSTVALVVALLIDVAAIPPQVTVWVSRASTGIGWLIGIAIATGFYTQVLAQLVLWSL